MIRQNTRYLTCIFLFPKRASPSKRKRRQRAKATRILPLPTNNQVYWLLCAFPYSLPISPRIKESIVLGYSALRLKEGRPNPRPFAINYQFSAFRFEETPTIYSAMRHGREMPPHPACAPTLLRNMCKYSVARLSAWERRCDVSREGSF